jgi:hypothetical protein
LVAAVDAATTDGSEVAEAETHDDGNGPAPEAAPDEASDARGDVADSPSLDVRDAASEATVDATTRCGHPIDDTWSYTLTPTSIPWRLAFGDPHIDVGAGKLVLTYDDVARREKWAGGYYFTFDIELDADVTFYVGAPGAFVLHPALAREGDVIVLSGAHYAMAGLEPVGSFTGQRIPAASLRVTFFAEANAQRVAMRVVVGDRSYASGFVGIGRDLSEIMLVGNNAGAGDGPAHLGSLRGCAGLDDSEVEAVYGGAGGP